jgi:hypothetical protein
MIRLAAMILTAAIVFAAASAFAQAPPPSQTPGGAVLTPKPDRTISDKATREEMARKRAALKQKKIDCRKQASAQKLHLVKRSRFIKQCMRG